MARKTLHVSAGRDGNGRFVADGPSADHRALGWLRTHGLKWSFKCTKLWRCEWFKWFMNSITPTKATWNGCNASGWRTNVVAVNGFNEEMHYGGQDREFGERMWNSGLKSKQIRYSAIALHLDHKRPYKTAKTLEKNMAIRRETIKSGIVRTPFGIEK